MRPLVMDFRTDVRAENTGDEFMYGPAFLVSPVTEPAATSRRVYLPDTKWYDFWNGVSVDGAREVNAEAPLDELRLFIRTGSIVPLGRNVAWATEKPADPIELRIYPERMASSRCMKMKMTTMTMSRASTLGSRFVGMMPSAL